jgi:hypothetical protein
LLPHLAGVRVEQIDCHSDLVQVPEILTQRQGHDLPTWMDKIEQAGSAALRSFVAGLRTDMDAVTAGLTLPHSSGPVDGTVNRIILWNLTCHPCRSGAVSTPLTGNL